MLYKDYADSNRYVGLQQCKWMKRNQINFNDISKYLMTLSNDSHDNITARYGYFGELLAMCFSYHFFHHYRHFHHHQVSTSRCFFMDLGSIYAFLAFLRGFIAYTTLTKWWETRNRPTANATWRCSLESRGSSNGKCYIGEFSRGNWWLQCHHCMECAGSFPPVQKPVMLTWWTLAKMNREKKCVAKQTTWYLDATSCPEKMLWPWEIQSNGSCHNVMMWHCKMSSGYKDMWATQELSNQKIG